MLKPVKKVNMNIVTKLETPAIITRDIDTLDYSPYLIGKEKTSYLCGNCNLVLLKKVKEEDVKGFSYRCPKCYSYNSLKE